MSKHLAAPTYCNQPWSTIYIPWHGRNVMPCCYGPFDLGNFNCDSFEEIWNGDKFSQVRDGLITGKYHANCRICMDNIRPYNDHIFNFDNKSVNDIKRENFVNTKKGFVGKGNILKSYPLVIFLDVSSRCNIACRKCYVHNDPTAVKGDMSFEVFEKIEPFFKYCLRVVFTGVGECLMNKDIYRMIERVKHNECDVVFNTNGSLLDENKIENLVVSGVDEIIFSIDSIDSDLYSYLHRGSSLKKVVNNIDLINDMKAKYSKSVPRLGWFFVGMKSNIGELKDVIEFASLKKFSSLYVAPLNIPVEGQKLDYFEFYNKQNLLSNDSDKLILFDNILLATNISKNYNIEFRSGY